MTMPIDNWHTKHLVPSPKFTQQTTGWKYPTNMVNISGGYTGGWTGWSSLGSDDLGNNEQVVFGSDGVRENVAYTSNSLLVKAFNGNKIIELTDIVDSISFGFYALMDSDGTRDYNMRVSKVAVGTSLPIVFPSTDLATRIFPIFSNGIYANGLFKYIMNIPVADLGIGQITPQIVNNKEFYVAFRITKTAGSSTNVCRARFYHVAIAINYHTPDPPPPGGGTDAANLIKFSTF